MELLTRAQSLACILLCLALFVGVPLWAAAVILFAPVAVFGALLSARIIAEIRRH